jgi:tRNA(fMet)-specific endonuclease VapC
VKVILDTNAYTALRRGHEKVAEHVRRSDGVLFSAIVAGELLYGFRHGTRLAQNLRDLEGFLADPEVRFLPVAWSAAEHFGKISADLRRKGKPIPTNDIWIAAQAIDAGAELISADPHFEKIEGLAWIHFPAA